jgi:hypothetical protein
MGAENTSETVHRNVIAGLFGYLFNKNGTMGKVREVKVDSQGELTEKDVGILSVDGDSGK